MPRRLFGGRVFWLALLPLAGLALGWFAFAALQSRAGANAGANARAAWVAKTGAQSQAPAAAELALVQAAPPERVVGVVHPRGVGRRPPSAAPPTEAGGDFHRAPGAGRRGRPGPSNPPRHGHPGAAEPARRGRPRLAIVIDDIGHNLRRPRQFLSLGVPLTFSILPGLPYSRAAARMILHRGRAYLIHLPMEPMDYPTQNPGAKPLLLGHDDRFTKRRMESFLAEFPGAVGASTHMGSAFTYDARKMGIVQGVVAAGGLFFLNSRTSSSPVPERIARHKGYRFLQRDVFLDNVRTEGAVRSQLERALQIARAGGRAVAIGHPYNQTYRALKKFFSSPLAGGVRLVPLPDLMER